jgi:hypothetical protein
VRQFAKAEGNLSKNDTIDAALISRFADKIEVRIIEEAPGDSPRDEVRYLKKYGVFW